MSIAKQYTGESNESVAIAKFRAVLTSREMFYNKEKFPANESNENAFMKCTNEESARTFCPKRMKAMEAWINSTRKVRYNGMLVPVRTSLYLRRRRE